MSRSNDCISGYATLATTPITMSATNNDSRPLNDMLGNHFATVWRTCR
jgi:hypothetical protein